MRETLTVADPGHYYVGMRIARHGDGPAFAYVARINRWDVIVSTSRVGYAVCRGKLWLAGALLRLARRLYDGESIP